MAFRSLGGSKIVGQGKPQTTPITLDADVYEGAIAYGDDGNLYFSNGTSWLVLEDSGGAVQGTTGIQGTDGLQGGYGPGFTVVGSVADVNVDPPNDQQSTLNTAFPSPSTGDAVIDEALDELWVYNGSLWVNVGNFRGVQGFTGIQGAQGMQGTIGYEGIQGSTGFRGFQGTQGFQGETGVQGAQGIQGNQGTQGVQGMQGTTGIQGDLGIQGSQGTQGPQSIQGTTGIQGDLGIQGTTGSYGGISFEYGFSDTTSAADPGAATLRYNNAAVASVTEIYIDDLANPGSNDISAVWNAIDAITNPIKATIKLTKVSNIADFAIFQITDITDNTGWFTLNVSFVGSSGVFANTDDIIVSVSESGAQGVQGVQGDQGIQGVQGFIGFQGVQGPQSTQGTQGIQGTTGIQGLQGVQGFLGYQGVQGMQGTQGHQGVQGGSGFQGTQGTTGIQGDQGLQGQIGYNGGLTYMWGFNNSTTEGFPGLNSWLLNNADVTQADKLYIDDLTDSGRRVDELFNYLDAVTSNPKGQIFIRTPKDATGGYQFLIFEYTDWVWGVTGTGSDWGHFVVNLIEQSELEGSDLSPGTSWDSITSTYGTDAVFTFNPSGNAGSQGAQGTQGHQGVQGLQGHQGVQGPQSIQGTTGIQGAQGIQGVEGARDFTVTNLSSIAYVIDGVNNPDLNLLRGFTYRFIVNSPGHPFWIKTAPSTGTGDAYNTGVTNNGIDVGEITFRVPANAPVTLYYQCQNHAAMGGELRTSDLGPQGTQGTQGFQGTTGIQGDSGLQGTTGAGAQGVQGFQGDLGFQGTQGFPGPIGPQGIQGATGIQGGGGVQGATGSFGGVTFDYTWNSQTTIADPGIGNVSLNNATYSSATALLIDDRDDNFTNLVPFLQTIDDSTSPIKGHVKITSKTNVDQFILFAINSLVDENGYFNVNVSYVSGSVSGTWPNGEDVTITFARTGDVGPTGSQGIQGYEGFQGPPGLQGGGGGQGVQGIQGEAIQGVQGIQGFGGQGVTGIQGNDGAQGLQGPQGAEGIAGDEGVQGLTGFQGATGSGAQGIQGTDGAQGIAGIGASGVQGFQGIQGTALQGHQGVQGDVGPAGFGNQGTQGFQGSQGTIGEDGVQGFQGPSGQGTAGLQGVQGLDGDEGAQGAQGVSGTGNQGVQGFQGSAGIGADGIQGNDGAQGIQGTKGESGVGGTQGVQGFTGIQGFQGITGGLGNTGGQGVQGVPGEAGPQGATGQGTQGLQGYQGTQGALGIQGFPGQGTQGIQGTQAAQGFQGERGFQGTQGPQGFGPAGSVPNIQNVHESPLQDTALFITMLEGGSTERPLLATNGPNPGGESNFFYTSDVDELTVENLQIEGNATIVGQVTAAEFTLSGANDFHIPADVNFTFGGTAANPYVKQGYVTSGGTYDWQVTSAVNEMRFKDQGSTTYFTFDILNGGDFTAAGDISANSDERLKENIETIDNALEKVSNMRGVYFDMKSNPGVRKVGLIAQEVEAVLPEVVKTDSEGEQIKSVAYANIVGLLIEAVKELKDEIDELKNQ